MADNEATSRREPPAKGPRASTSSDSAAGRDSQDFFLQVPTVSLPRGGGALKGIDEKFTINAANGTASMALPLPLTPGRAGATPSLALTYNSGSGNGVFGLGWSLGLPAIQRR